MPLRLASSRHANARVDNQLTPVIFRNTLNYMCRWRNLLNKFRFWRLKTMAEEPSAKKRKEDSSDEEISEGPAPKAPQLRRKKCILLLSYCGKGYMGMQKLI